MILVDGNGGVCRKYDKASLIHCNPLAKLQQNAKIWDLKLIAS